MVARGQKYVSKQNIFYQPTATNKYILQTQKKSIRKYALFLLCVFAKEYQFIYNGYIKEYQRRFEMYVNDRDQVNYHGFLRALREMNKVSQEAVSKGICTVSGMNRFENGNRVAEKLMRDRLTARLGIAGEKYEDYLQPKEYVRWEHRLRIINAIEKRNLKRAHAELASYEKLEDLNRINIQFIESMRFILLELEGASEETLLECINKAVKCTVSNVKKALEGEHLLADQELNLIAEQIRLYIPKKTIRDINSWRITEYEKLITYMDNSYWEDLQKAKVYPKLAYYISKCILEKDASVEELKRALELCNTAIELLRDTSRLYYFIELTETRSILGARIMEMPIKENEYQLLQDMLKENYAWEKLFKDLYKEYDIRTYMSDFCYLYYETECHDMVEVIETRRKMLGLSRVTLGEGICTDRTIVRFEREGRNPTIELVRRLFDKLGMCAEYRRARIITNDVEALKLYELKLANAINDVNVEEGLKYIAFLSDRVDMNIPYNKQELERMEKYLRYNGGEINVEQFIEDILCAMKYTLTESALSNKKKKYFTNIELICIHDIAFNGESKLSSDCLRIIEKECINEVKNGISTNKLTILELLMERMASKLGDEGKYEESCEMSDVLLKECLLHYRMKDLANPLYNKVWNYQQSNGSDRMYINHNLHKCALLCQINRKYNTATFFQKEIR